MKEYSLNVLVDKYTIQQKKDGSIIVLRNNEEWRICTGDNLIFSMAVEIEKLREIIKGETK